jgi:putative acetyltransferase
MDTIRIVEARTPDDLASARQLIDEYATSLDVSLCFQDLAHELDHLPEVYGPPSGDLLLARRGALDIGCVAFRPFDTDTCEMKRLYVRPEARGRTVGHLLARAVIERACVGGYRRIVLDTLSTMTAARALYRSLGFRETAPYYRNPLAGVVYMELAVMSGR